MIENKEAKSRVILAAVCVGEETETVASLEELGALAETAGAEVVSTLLQNREHPDPGTYLGAGKIQELKELCDLLEADTVICDDELSPAQMKNLEEALDRRVADRTLLILDIFAARAVTSEGKIQVELAQLQYRQAHLVGMRAYLSRQGGGIGTRGPGEKQLEMDHRLIAQRIHALTEELKEVKRHREVLREGRRRKHILTCAIVGYTNAGKSTLLNTLTGAGVLEQDALFATLDPTTRLLQLPGGAAVLLTDTVGFIHKLPHTLIQAFRSTLEEATEADMLLHVVDASNPRAAQQMAVVYQTLHELGADKKTILTLFNKQDQVSPDAHLRDARADVTLGISAKHGEGLDALLLALEEQVRARQVLVERVFSYQEAGKLALIRSKGQLLFEEYLPEGIAVRAYVPREIYGRL